MGGKGQRPSRVCYGGGRGDGTVLASVFCERLFAFCGAKVVARGRCRRGALGGVPPAQGRAIRPDRPEVRVTPGGACDTATNSSALSARGRVRGQAAAGPNGCRAVTPGSARIYAVRQWHLAMGQGEVGAGWPGLPGRGSFANSRHETGATSGVRPTPRVVVKSVILQSLASVPADGCGSGRGPFPIRPRARAVPRSDSAHSSRR